MATKQDLRADVLQAAALVRRDRKAGLARLNELFAQGTLPSPALNGRYRGALITTSINPLLDVLAHGFFGLWLPWKGKTFDSAAQSGDNLFSNDGLWLSRLFFPGYKGAFPDEPGCSRALVFRTDTGAGQDDPGTQVLKIDYDLAVNPSFVVREVLDELVQVGDGYYLGKAHLRRPRGWRCAAYFTLASL